MQNKTVAILMCTYNGAQFLRMQLDSIISQKFKDWVLYVSDDGSDDNTLNILNEYENKLSTRLVLYSGPQMGFAANFMSLANNKNLIHDYYAFCDQDDIWLDDKLEAAIEAIERLGIHDGPNLYCGATFYTTKNLEIIKKSECNCYPPSFRNALVQSIAGGNTIVFDRKLKLILESQNISQVVSHDWWLYLMTTAVCGKVIYDSEAYVLYRQHGNNVIGENNTFIKKYERLLHVISGRFSKWLNSNIANLSKIKSYMHHTTVDVLDEFVRLQGAGLKDRIRILMTTGIYRQSARGTLTLAMWILFKKK